jgi:hypothetical protein
MIPALQSALSGLNAASVKLNQAAANIAQGSVQAIEATSTSSAQTPTEVSSGGDPFSNSFTAFGEESSLTSNIVAIKEAELLYKASASLIGTLGDLESEFLDITD